MKASDVLIDKLKQFDGYMYTLNRYPIFGGCIGIWILML